MAVVVEGEAVAEEVVVAGRQWFHHLLRHRHHMLQQDLRP
jgi:hypothetical protein